MEAGALIRTAQNVNTMALSGADILGAQSPGKAEPLADPSSIERCSLCSATISLLQPSLDVPARPWLCGGCGSVYFACAADSAAGRSGKARVVPYEQIVDIAGTQAQNPDRRVPRRALKQLVRFLGSAITEAENKRKEPRYPAILPVIAIPLGRNFRVIGQAVQMTTINISRSGTALLDIDSCSAPYLALDFAVAGMTARAVLEVLRIRPVLSASEVAGRLKCRIVT
jgi:hypothetical protein